jgi:putative OPT family oligopeptide transporter
MPSVAPTPSLKPDAPHIPASVSLPEITVKAVALGIILSMTLAAANAYLGLFAGMTVSASIPAAVISMALLRLFREHNILENNLVQTAASAGESLAAGVIFTLPALIVLGAWTSFNYIETTLLAGLGGVIGVLLTIPLRRALIVESDLKFPEGVATAEVLQSGEEGGSAVKYLVWSALIGAVFKFGEAGLQLWTATAERGKMLGGWLLYGGSNLSPALVAVGYIVGRNIAVLVFAGGAISWLFGIPIWLLVHGPEALPPGAEGADAAGWIWSNHIRYMGIGAMVVGGLWAIVNLRGSLVSGIRSGIRTYRHASAGGPAVLRTDHDAPMPMVLGLLVLSVIPIFIIYLVVVKMVGVSLLMAVLMLVAAFLFSAVAAYMAGLVGSSNNPISGVTIATILSASLLLVVLVGREGEVGAAGAIIIGAVVCCAAAIAGDNMQDLKAGYILGATPWKQQTAQILGTVTAALVMAPILTLLLKGYGIGIPTPDHPNPLTAPQATLMASVAHGVFRGGLPWTMAAIGAVIAVGIILFDQFQASRGAVFRTPVLAVAVGIYLPFELSVPIFIGGLVAHAAARTRSRMTGAAAPAERFGLLFASGLITGEAMVGILLAVPLVAFQRNVFALTEAAHFAWPGMILLVGVLVFLYRSATAKAETA